MSHHHFTFFSGGGGEGEDINMPGLCMSLCSLSIAFEKSSRRFSSVLV
jgi:hypothetical protein